MQSANSTSLKDANKNKLEKCMIPSTVNRFVMVAWPILLGTGLIGTFFAVFGPRLGLGINETFFFYKLTGIDRSSMLLYALISLASSIPIFLFSYPQFLKAGGLILCALGASLLFINIYGASLGTDVCLKTSKKPEGFILGGEQKHLDIESLNRLNSESNVDYVTRVTFAVHDGLRHHWNPAQTRIPFPENWILWARSFVNSSFRDYEFHDPSLAFKRGYGLCSQFSLIITNILEKNGIRTKIIGIGAHVLSMAEVSTGKWYLTDGDYGIVAPYSLAEVEKNTDLIIPYYEKRNSPDVGRMFNPEDNEVFETHEYRGDLRQFENLSYILKWLLPVFFISIGFVLVRMLSVVI